MDLSDEYVARLLCTEAKDRLQKNTETSALRENGSKHPVERNKPNTRFLHHVLRSTDAHNSALRDKERRESHHKRRKLDQPSRSEPSTFPDTASGRASLKTRQHEDRAHYRRHGRSHEFPEPSKARRRKRDDDSDSDGSKSHYSRRNIREHGCHERHEPRSRSYNGEVDNHRRDHPRKGEQAKQLEEPSRSAFQTRSHRNTQHTPKGDTGSKIKYQPSASLSTPNLPADPDASPLAVRSAVSPSKSPTTIRGRGTRGTLAMDEHFQESYDPCAEPYLNTGRDDDSNTDVESRRIHEEWTRKGAERLQSAGFTLEQVERWKGSGRENDVANVRWTKKGESREWDRGKVLEGDHVGFRPAWSQERP